MNGPSGCMWQDIQGNTHTFHSSSRCSSPRSRFTCTNLQDTDPGLKYAAKRPGRTSNANVTTSSERVQALRGVLTRSGGPGGPISISTFRDARQRGRARNKSTRYIYHRTTGTGSLGSADQDIGKAWGWKQWNQEKGSPHYDGRTPPSFAKEPWPSIKNRTRLLPWLIRVAWRRINVIDYRGRYRLECSAIIALRNPLMCTKFIHQIGRAHV